MILLDFADEILLQICSNLTSHELFQLSLSCRTLSRVAFDILSQSIRLDYAYHDDRSVWKLNDLISQLKRRSVGAVSRITIAHLAWPTSSVQLRRRMLHILSTLSNVRTLHLKEHFGPFHGIHIQNDTPIELEENFYDVLMRTSCASSIRSLTIEDSRISVHDILKLFSMKQLEQLSIDGFNNPMAVVPGGKIHNSQLESLAISVSRNPTGRHIDLLFSRTPRLKKLSWHFDFSWIVDEDKFRQTLSPAAISKALSPLRHKLVELNISLEPAPFKNDGTELDLSNFLRLRKLKIHDRVLLPSDKDSGSVVSRTGLDLQLSRCLPANLETLDIRFDMDRKTDATTAGNYEWVLAFAKVQRTHFKFLRSLLITERECREANDGAVEKWEREPADCLRRAFDEAGITLRVLKRSNGRQEGITCVVF